jgi:23S rRNA (pseudouridine1915-N3)-methyltransferase
MRVRVIAVGTRMPAWVRSASGEYLERLTSAPGVVLREIAPAARGGAADTRMAIAAEGRRLLGELRRDDHVAALDERGAQLSTRELAEWLNTRMHSGEDLAFVIGGPDGLAPAVLARSNTRLALSRLTLPHALARVLLLEQLYRARALLAHHPYHRD